VVGFAPVIQYLKACESKIADNQDCLDWWTRWIIGLAIADGTIALPSGMDGAFTTQRIGMAFAALRGKNVGRFAENLNSK
jgi:hypothetical protein